MSSAVQKIGVFSGTFDPVHDGHVQFALDALGRHKLDRVYFMVEQNPRRKQGVRAYEHRQAMVQLAIKDEPKLGTIIIEQDRFTPHETLPLLKNRFGAATKIYLLAGDDMLSHMHEWPHIEDLVNNVSFIFGVRGEKELAEKRIAAIEKNKSLHFDVAFVSSMHDSISSSRIRSILKAKQNSPYLHPAVAAYIKSEGLYSSPTADSAKN